MFIKEWDYNGAKMNDNKLTGIVKAVNKKGTGLLLITPDNLNGEWWNTHEASLIAILTEVNIIGKEITLTISNLEDHLFSYFFVVGTKDVKASVPSANERTPVQLPSAVKGFVDKDRLIVRQSSSNQSANMIIALINNGKYPNLDLETIKKDWKLLAGFIEEWDFRGDSK